MFYNSNMRIKNKILLSNIIIVGVPILLTLFFTIVYSCNLDFEESKQIKFQNIYSQYKKRLSDVDWNVLDKIYGSSGDAEHSEDLQLIKELYDSGVRLKIISERKVLFTNFKEDDNEFFYSHIGSVSDVEICFISYMEKFFICDVLESEKYSRCEVFVAYDDPSSDTKVKNSFVPVYMVPSTLMAVFAIILVLSILIDGVIIMFWLGNSILNPLELFKKETEEIAKGNLSRKLVYDNEDEFREVINGLEKMRLSLKTTEAKQSNYEENRKSILLGISHDLRSPLTSIKGYACGLKDGIARTEEKKQFYYDAIITRTDDMENMVKRLYELLRFDVIADIIKPRPENLNKFISDFLTEKKVFLSEKNVTVDLDLNDEIIVNIDTFEMKRVFVNFFENTIKYRNSDSSLVKIKLSKKNGFAELIFKDDGPGVEEKHLEKIFEIFYKIDESRAAKGNGLGLAIVKKLIVGHNGSIKAFNDDGLGFMITLPILEEGECREKNTDN